MTAWLVLLLVARTAAATPLEPLWETKVACTRHDLVAAGDSLAWVEGDTIQRIDRATGKLAKPLRLEKRNWDGNGIIGWLGDAWLVETWQFLAAVDATTGAVRWEDDPNTAMVVDGDVITLRHKDGAVAIDRLAGATGKRVWHAMTVPNAPNNGWRGTDGARLYVVTLLGPKGENYLQAFDLATGKALWSHTISGKSQGITVLGATVIYSDGSLSLHVFDGATGAPRPDIPLGAPARELQADATHLYAATASSVIAYDTIKHAIQWTQVRETDQLLAATPAALYVVSHELVRALDPLTGRELASYGIAEHDLIFTAADRSAPMFVLCDREHTMSALDPTGHTLAAEHATITGKLVCTNCKQPLPPIDVTIGDAKARTDAHGAFTIALDVRGELQLVFELPPIDSPMAWVPSSKDVTFAGKHTYSFGRIAVRRDCGPLQSPCE